MSGGPDRLTAVETTLKHHVDECLKINTENRDTLREIKTTLSGLQRGFDMLATIWHVLKAVAKWLAALVTIGGIGTAIMKLKFSGVVWTG
jgi:hypothetical protein